MSCLYCLAAQAYEAKRLDCPSQQRVKRHVRAVIVLVQHSILYPVVLVSLQPTSLQSHCFALLTGQSWRHLKQTYVPQWVVGQLNPAPGRLVKRVKPLAEPNTSACTR